MILWLWLGSAFKVAPRARMRVSPLKFLSPEMSGFIEKTLRPDAYEAVVIETMRREDCSRQEAVAKYNQYLFDPTGYAVVKMQEQLQQKGFSSFKEAFIAEHGEAAWDERQKNFEAAVQQRRQNSVVIVGVLFAAFVALQEYLESTGGG